MITFRYQIPRGASLAVLSNEFVNKKAEIKRMLTIITGDFIFETSK